MIKSVKIGFFGFGVVGSRLVRIILEKREQMINEYGIRFEIGAILVRDINKPRSIDVKKLRLTTDVNEILDDADTGIIIECMGGSGTDRTREIVLKALNNKKQVVMSSKKCLALYSHEIFEAAKINDCQVRFESTVGGGIPICSVLRNIAKGEEITRIYGIWNATSNFILSVMQEEKSTYEEAVLKAKEKGYSENDPTEDVDGWDAAYKLGILMDIGMKAHCDIKKLQPKSLKGIKTDDVITAGKNGEVIKQIAYVKKGEDSSINYYIGPYRIKNDNFLAKVSDNNNMILVEGKLSGIRAFYGQGAGAGPTASVMFDDLVDIVRNKYTYHNSCICNTIMKEVTDIEI